MKRNLIIKFVFPVILFAIFISCNKDSGAEPQTPAVPAVDSTYVNVEWTNETVVFGESDLTSLLDYDDEFSYVVFNTSNQKAKYLKKNGDCG